MRLSLITEDAIARLKRLYFDKLQKVAGDIPGTVLKPTAYVTSSLGTPAHGWFADFSCEAFPELSADIGIDYKTRGIRVSHLGAYISWSELRAALEKLAARWTERIEGTAAATQKQTTKYGAIFAKLDELWSRTTIGTLRLTMSDGHVGNVLKRKYEIVDTEQTATHGESTGLCFNTQRGHNIRGTSALPLQFAGYEIVLNLTPNKFKWLLETATLPWEAAKERINSIQSTRLSSTISYSADFNHWNAYQTWRLLHALVAGEVAESLGPRPERYMRRERDDLEELDSTLHLFSDALFNQGFTINGSAYHIRSNAPNSWSRRPWITASGPTDYGPVLVRAEWTDESGPDNPQYVVTASMGGHAQKNERWQGYGEQQPQRGQPGTHELGVFTAEALEQLAPRFIEFLEQHLAKAYLEHVIRTAQVLTEEDSDDIDVNMVEMLREVLAPFLEQHPEVDVKISKRVNKQTRYHLAVLSTGGASSWPAAGRPVKGKELVIAIERGTPSNPDGTVTIKVGNSYRNITTDEELYQVLEPWADGGQIPPPTAVPARRVGWHTPAHQEPRKRPQNLSTTEKTAFFPRSAYLLDRKIPGRQVSQGRSFTIAIHAKNMDFPPEIFAAMDLHHIGTSGSHYLGWIGGSINEDAMYIDEVQSDLMQRTLEMTDQERFNREMATAIQQKEAEIKALRRQLADLKQNQPNAMASDRFRLVEQIQDKIKELEADVQKSRRMFKLSAFAGFKSRIENAFKTWIQAFYHTAFNHAREQGIVDVYIITSNMIGQIWRKAQGKENDDTSVYARAYDKVAESLGATREGDWWHVRLADIPFKEDWDQRHIAAMMEARETITEGMDSDLITRWLGHAGFAVHSIQGRFPDADYDRLNLVVSKVMPDGTAVMTKEFDDLDPESMQRAFSFIQQGQYEAPIETTPYEIEELGNDAALLLTATQIIDGVPYGLAIYTLDEPGAPRYVYDPEEENDQDAMSDEELFGFTPDEIATRWRELGGD